MDGPPKLMWMCFFRRVTPIAEFTGIETGVAVPRAVSSAAICRADKLVLFNSANPGDPPRRIEFHRKSSCPTSLGELRSPSCMRCFAKVTEPTAKRANYEAIIWPARYVHLHRLLITVGVVAHMRALDRDMQYAARRLRRPLYLVRDLNAQARQAFQVTPGRRSGCRAGQVTRQGLSSWRVASLVYVILQ